MEEEVETAPENITKLVINNQIKTELHKSPPIKTYSKKSPESGGTPTDCKSRYGRERKHNISSDFLSTDHRLGQYLKQETVKEAYFKKTTSPKKQAELKKPAPKGLLKRGRPRKSLPNLTEAVVKESTESELLNKSLPAIDIVTDYQAPAPTSTETLPVPTELKGVKAESDVEEEVEDADWNCGDLAWAAVPSFPYWPCAITRDPIDRTFVKRSVFGRSTKPQMLLHVRFFGDNGRRSWVKATNLMSFSGLDDYQNLVEETCTPELKRTDLKMYKMFTVAPGQRKTWQAAVSEAESLLASPRSERILYFETLYPVNRLPGDSDDDDIVLSTPKTVRKKRKIVEESSSIIKPVVEKKSKLDYNRYSIDLETLALQAAPITPRAIFVNKQVSPPLANNTKSPIHKRQYIKKSEKWLLCKNKTVTGIIANGLKKPELVPKTSLKDSNHEADNNSEATKDVEDDFAVPPAAEVPLTPSSATTELISRNSALQKDVTLMEFETFENQSSKTTHPPDYDVRSMDDSNTGDVVNEVCVSEISSIETSQDANSLNILKLDKPPNINAADVLLSNVNSSDLSSSEITPVKRKRGRPRKTLDTKSPINTNHTKQIETLPSPRPKTESKILEPMTPSRRSRIKKLVTTPDIKSVVSLDKPKVKTSASKSPKKVKKSPKNQEDSLEIRKFGYKGSKVFKKFLELNFDKIVDERPDLSVKDVKKYIEDLWLGKTDLARQKFKSRLEAEASEEFTVDNCIGDKADNPLALPTKSIMNQSKKVPSLFTGIRVDRVCQICHKGDNLIKCKGSCVKYYHKECGDTRTVIMANDSQDKSPKKRGKKKKPLTADDIKPEVKIKTEPQSPAQSRLRSSNKAEVETCSKLKVENMKKEKLTNEPNESSIATEESVKLEENDHEKIGTTSKSQNDTDHDLKPENSNAVAMDCDSQCESTETKDKNNLDELICEKENVLPTDSDELISKNISENGSSKVSCDSIKKRNLECGSMDKLKSRAQVSKSDSVSSEGSIKSEADCKSESDKSESLEETEFKKTTDSAIKKKGKLKKANDSELEKGKQNGSTWKCLMCRENVEDTCFVCRTETTEEKTRCCISSCGLVYHMSCVEIWPQATSLVGAKKRTVLTCPQHSCHTCISDNPKANMPKYGMDKLVRCLYCPTSYHHSNYCVPAGCEILSNSQIICSRHYDGPSKLHHVNAAWCFICSVGGSLICCDLCPNSFHVECLNIPSPEGAFICEDCETGRYPLFGEIIWVKLGAYRWWPARIMFPSEIPINIEQLPHRRGEFAVRFFGSHDHYWVNRGRVFLYHEGDGVEVATKSRVDKIFNQAMIEAKEAFTVFTAEREEKEAVSKSVMKPPKYIKLNKNVCQDSRLSSLLKPVEGYVANLTPCYCNPEQDNPCGPNSDCINRLLMIECNPQVCPAKDKCCNQNFEKRLYPSLTPVMTDSRGWGLKTNEPIKKGDFIIEYVGEIIGEVEYQNRLIEMEKKKNENYYFLTIDKDTMIDAGPKGNVARFMNHSCDPNCETQKWTVNGITRVGLFALHDIPKDTELVFNYQLETIGNSKVACKCGAKTCSGFIGGAKSINKTQNGESSKKVESEKKKPKEKKKVKRVKSSAKAMIDVCFTCDQGGELLLCDAPNCPNCYHLSCLGLTKEPTGEWTCPVHQCSVCNNPKVKRCALCINSYCSKHAQGNIVKHKIHGMICTNHALSEESSEMEVDTKSTSSSMMAGDTRTSKVKTLKGAKSLTTVPELSASDEVSLHTEVIDSCQLNGHAPT